MKSLYNSELLSQLHQIVNWSMPQFNFILFVSLRIPTILEISRNVLASFLPVATVNLLRADRVFWNVFLFYVFQVDRIPGGRSISTRRGAVQVSKISKCSCQKREAKKIRNWSNCSIGHKALVTVIFHCFVFWLKSFCKHYSCR